MCLVVSSVTISSLFNFSLYAQHGGAAIDGSAPCYGNTAIAMAGLLLVEQLQVQKIQVDQLLVGANETPSSPKTPNGFSIYSSREFGICIHYPSS